MHLRQHELERRLREYEEREREAKKKFWNNVLVVKVAVTVFFILTIVLPPQHAQWAGMAGNFLWLWRT